VKFTIAKKLTLLVTTVVVITTGGLGYSVNSEYDKILTEKELLDMGDNTREEAAKILGTIERMKEDVIFLSSTPPIQGIIRSQQNNGVDHLDGSSEKTWTQRLEKIFISFLQSKLGYLEISYISQQKHRVELIAVDRYNGKIRTRFSEKLKNTNTLELIKDGTIPENKKVHLSEITYISDFRKTTKSYSSVLYAYTPIYTNKGRIFGMVVISLNTDHLFSQFLSTGKIHNGQHEKYIVTEKRKLLSKYDDNESYTYESGNSSLTISEHPNLSNFLSGKREEIAIKTDDSVATSI